MALGNSGKSLPNTVRPARFYQRPHRISLVGLALTLLVGAFTVNGASITDHPVNKGIFLVATEKLADSSFKETVILITHFSEKGATGLAINRPSEFQLKEVFPDREFLRHRREDVYLGGPVGTHSVFVLMRTQRPHAGMYNIAKDLYFAAGIEALTHGLDNLTGDEYARAYVGYSGWGPGQLEYEIHRGDWILVHADTDIVFDLDYRAVWKKLFKSWSGQWI